MTIGRLDGAGTAMQPMNTLGAQEDSVSRNLKQQIANEQKKLQELSSNQELEMEEKMKRRQEIQQEINSLNNQLRQRQNELRKEQQENRAVKENSQPKKQDASREPQSGQEAGLSSAGMKAVISADSSMKQAGVQGRVSSALEGRAGVLEAEIKQDGARGVSTEKKEAELAEVAQRSSDAEAAQLHTLGDAKDDMDEAAAADRERSNSGEEAEGSKSADDREDGQNTGTKEEDTEQHMIYTPVDVRI